MRKKNVVLQRVPVQDYAAEGRAIGRIDGKVVFIEGAVPGDVVDVQLSKNKKEWSQGKAIRFHELSKDRVEAFCAHFGVCGGCKWQMLPYEKQLAYKQQEVEQHLRRIGKIELPAIEPIIGCTEHTHYRNKLEFTFSNKRYLLPSEIGRSAFAEASEERSVIAEASADKPAFADASADKPAFADASGNNPAQASAKVADRVVIPQENALGFHVPRLFDKVIDITTCHLMQEPANAIKNTIREFAKQQDYSFYDIKAHTGWLRTLIIRICTTGEVMVNICFGHEDEPERNKLLDHLLTAVPAITTLLYTINPKWNDTIYDLQPQVYFGKGYITEKLKTATGKELLFKIGPKSFFQTNTGQAGRLYQVTAQFAELSGKEVVYDLYCGTGSIGLFVSENASKIVGVESVAEAVEDAKENAKLNNIQQAHFYSGDVIDICNDRFFAEHGRPDVIITDPPRAGMHEKLVRKILDTEAPVVVYVSCNPATQARDLNWLDEKYVVTRVQPVDMFPHTHHIENVVQLKLK